MFLNQIIPCLAILAFFVPLFIFIVVLRYLSYRETLALAEKGLVRPQKPSDGKEALKAGIFFSALGIALCLGTWPIGFIGPRTFPLGLGPWMLPGLLLAFMGLAFILIHILTYDRNKPKPSTSEKLNALDDGTDQ